MPASDNPNPTRLRDLYKYVGDDTMAQLPSLKSGARSWIGLLQSHPSLQGIQTKHDLALWIDNNPNLGVSLDDFNNYEKLLRYQGAFPNGLPSEELQRRIQTEIRSDQIDTPTPLTHSSQNHNTLDQLTKVFDPKGVEHDRNFKRILKNVVENHNRINPNNPFNENLVVWKNRQRILNPNLPPELLTQARALFGEAIGENRLRYLDNQEANRIYNKQVNDPAVQKMERLIRQELEARVNQERAAKGTISQAEIQTLEKQIRQTHTAQFVRDYPEKAEVYSRKNKELKAAKKEDQELRKQLHEVEKDILKQRDKIYRINPQNDPVVKNLKAGKLTPEEFVKRYPKKAKAYRRRIEEIGIARKTFIQAEKTQKKQFKNEQKQIKNLKNHRDPKTDLELQKIKNKYPNRLTDPRQKSAFDTEINEFVRKNKRASFAEYLNDSDIRNARTKIASAQSYLDRPSRLSRLFGRTPVLPDLTNNENQQDTETSQQIQQSQQPRDGKRRLERTRTWIKKQYEKRKKQIQDAARRYLGREFRRIASQAAKNAARYASSFARSSVGPGIRNASRAFPKLGSLPRPGLGAGRLGGFRPPVPPAAAGLVANPWFWVVLIIIIILILILLWFLHDDLNSGDVTVNVTKSGPAEVPNPTSQDVSQPDPSDIQYSITVSWTGGPSNITVTDYIPENTEFVSATGDYKLSGATGSAQTVVWNIRGSSGNSTGAGQNVPPTTDTCGGVYNLGNSDGQNFGDPNCELAEAERVSHSFQGESWNIQKPLFDMVQEMDPQDADYWFGVIECESGFNPNVVAIGPHADAAGVWGLYQMGASGENTGSGWRDTPFQDKDGRNGEFDRGDVHWSLQTSNAINYQEKKLAPLGLKWEYWECAKIVWGLW